MVASVASLRSSHRLRAEWRTIESAPLIPIAAATALIRLMIGPATIDDAYITFRYARNVATGHGFVYNVGQHVIGTTTPLWTLLLAAGYRLGFHDVSMDALVLGALADALTGALLIRLARFWGFARPWAYLVGILFALSPLSITYTVAGMEAPLFSLLVLASVFAAAKERILLASLLAGLATVTRPEGVAVFALITASCLLKRRLPRLRILWPYMLTVAPWYAFAAWYTGQPLAHSVSAKEVVFRHQTSPLQGLESILSTFAFPGLQTSGTTLASVNANPLTHVLLAAGTPLLAAISISVLVAIPIFGPRVCGYIMRHPGHLALVAIAPLLACFYIVGAVRGVVVLGWYLVPLGPPYLLALTLIVQRVLRRLPYGWLAGTFVLLPWCVAGLNLGLRTMPIQPPMSLTREMAYLHAAAILAPYVTPKTTIAAPEIGALGYASRASILDTAGLVSPSALPYYPLPPGSTTGTIPLALVRHLRPDYIVAFDIHMQRQLAPSPWFHRQYRLIDSLPYNVRPWRARYLLVYEHHVPTT